MTVLINNAGVVPASWGLLTVTEADLRANMETNFFAPVLIARAFAPILAARRGTAIIDIHSVASWYAFAGAYSASKAALWSATNSLRLELAPEGVHVMGVHMGYVDTAMAAHSDGPKLQPATLVAEVFDALERGDYEVIADQLSREIKSALSAPIESLYPELQAAKPTGAL